MNAGFWIGAVVYAFFLFFFFVGQVVPPANAADSFMLYAGFLVLYAAVRIILQRSLKERRETQMTFMIAFKLGFRMSIASVLLASLVLVPMPGIADKIEAIIIIVAQGALFAVLAPAVIAFILVRTTFRPQV